MKVSDKQKRQMRKYYQFHSEVIKARARKFYLKNKNLKQYKLMRKKILEKYYQTPKGFYKILKMNSKRRNLLIKITQEEFITWYFDQNKICFYCGIPEDKLFIQNIKRLEIDRLDNNLPYSINNIVLACKWCNSVKSNILTKQEMQIVGRIVMKEKWQCVFR